MATPTPTTNTLQVGRSGLTIWHAVWATTDNFTDTIVVDLSGLTKHVGSLTIERIIGIATAGISFVLELDSTSDELVMSYPLTCVDVIDVDFTFGGRSGLTKQTAGGTGDLILSSASAASGDEILLYIYWKAS